jgi:hypothetical protein
VGNGKASNARIGSQIASVYLGAEVAFVARQEDGDKMTASWLGRLKTFYGVQTDMELIEAQNNHIEKLQAKVRELSPPEPAYRPVREG